MSAAYKYIYLKFLYLGVVTLLLSSCMAIPVAELQNYRNSFKQVFNSGSLLLDELSPIFSKRAPASGLANCGQNTGGIPRCFRPELARANAIREEHPAISVRRLVLTTIDTYNMILVDVAEGKPVDASLQKVEQLRGLVQTALSLGSFGGALPPLVDVIAKQGFEVFLNELKKPISLAMLRRLIKAGKEPVRDMLIKLNDDTPVMYRIYQKGTQLEIIKTRVLIRRLRVTSGNTAKPTAELEVLINKVNGYHAKLGAYVKVLDATIAALDALVDAVENPKYSIANTTAALKQVGVLQTRAEEFWRVVRRVN